MGVFFVRECLVSFWRDVLCLSGFRGYMGNLRRDYGGGFVRLLMSVYICLKGACNTLIVGVQLPFYKELGVTGQIYQLNTALAATPWAIKGLTGTLSDLYPIFGFKKKYYMIILSFLGPISLVLILLSPSEHLHSWLPPLCFFAVQLQISGLDLLCEGKYVECINSIQDPNSSVLTFVWLCVAAGSTLASLLIGPICDQIGSWLVLLMCVPLCGQTMFFLFRGDLPETAIEDVVAYRRSRYSEGRLFFILAVLSSLLAILCGSLSLTRSTAIRFTGCVFITVASCVSALLLLPRTLAYSNIYMYMQNVLYVDLSGGLEYFYMADENCVPSGPHFDLTYYYSIVGVISMFASGLGLWSFQTILSRCRFRTIFWLTSLIRILASLVDYTILRRWNLAYLHVSDKTMYILGNAIVANISNSVAHMCCVVLTCRLCPSHVESTVYAILAGYGNFGSTVSKLLGVILMDLAHIKSTPPCDFSLLPSLTLFCHAFLPLLTVLLTFLLVPDARMTDISLLKQATHHKQNQSEQNHSNPNKLPGPEDLSEETDSSHETNLSHNDTPLSEEQQEDSDASEIQTSHNFAPKVFGKKTKKKFKYQPLQDTYSSRELYSLNYNPFE